MNVIRIAGRNSTSNLHNLLKRGDSWTEIITKQEKHFVLLHCKNTCDESELSQQADVINGNVVYHKKESRPLLRTSFDNLGGAVLYVTAAQWVSAMDCQNVINSTLLIFIKVNKECIRLKLNGI